MLTDPLIGCRIGNLVIESKLASGGMGAVYLAHHVELAMRKVVKVLLPEFARTPELRSRFLREAQAVARLQHRYILEIDDFGQLPDDQLWLITPYLTGCTLGQHLHRVGTLSESNALNILLQLCSALAHAHNACVVHRDLKPGNVFLCGDLQGVKLLDFGIAKILDVRDDVRTRKGLAIGTPSYMPPEQYADSGHVMPWSDVYSLAIMACEMVTGRLPWGRGEPEPLYYKQMTEPPDLQGLSVSWQEILARALDRNPQSRVQSARTFGLSLAHVTPGGEQAVRTFAPEFLRDTPAAYYDITITPQPPGPLTTLGLSSVAVEIAPSRPAAAVGLRLAVFGLAVVLAVLLVIRGVQVHRSGTSIVSRLVDAGVVDAGVVDAGVVDAGVVDAGVVDAGVVDAGVKRVRKPPSAKVIDDSTFDPDSVSGH